MASAPCVCVCGLMINWKNRELIVLIKQNKVKQTTALPSGPAGRGAPQCSCQARQLFTQIKTRGAHLRLSAFASVRACVCLFALFVTQKHKWLARIHCVCVFARARLCAKVTLPVMRDRPTRGTCFNQRACARTQLHPQDLGRHKTWATSHADGHSLALLFVQPAERHLSL